MFFRRRDPLRRCPECASSFACPTGWTVKDAAHWDVALRCGECDNRWDAVMDDHRAARYDVELNRDMSAISRALERLDLERMATDAETLATAFARDLIGPADFAT